MKLRKLNRVLHRDLGYFFAGMTIIYALSGISLNHLRDWNPSYNIKQYEISLDKTLSKDEVNKDLVLEILDDIDQKKTYKSHYFPAKDKLKIFFKDGSIDIKMQEGKGMVETITRRPVFFQVNFLHYNPGVWWKYFSDIFSASLILIAITGLFILKGKNGITRRGAWLSIAGILIPILFLFIYH